MKKLLILLLLISISTFTHGEGVKLDYSEIPAETLEAIKSYSARTIAMMQQGGAEGFDYSEESVRFLHGVINEEGPTYSEKAKNMLPTIWGSYLGDALIKRYGGKWVLFGNAYAVLIDESKVFFPMAKVEKHIENGEEDSIYGLYLLAGSNANDIETQIK